MLCSWCCNDDFDTSVGVPVDVALNILIKNFAKDYPLTNQFNIDICSFATLYSSSTRDIICSYLGVFAMIRRCVFSWTGSGLKIGSAGVATGVGWVVGVRRGWDDHYSSQEGVGATTHSWSLVLISDAWLQQWWARGLLLLRAEQRRQKLDCWLSSTACKTQSSLKVPQLIVKRGLPEVIPQLVEHWLSH